MDHFFGKRSNLQTCDSLTAGAGRDSPEAQLGSQSPTASGNEVDDQDDQRNHKQKVNQAAGDVKAKAQKPQNQKNDENCP